MENEKLNDITTLDEELYKMDQALVMAYYLLNSTRQNIPTNTELDSFDGQKMADRMNQVQDGLKKSLSYLQKL